MAGQSLMRKAPTLQFRSVMKKQIFALISTTAISVHPMVTSAQSLSDKVNVHMKDVQWKIDYEKEIRPLEVTPKAPPSRPLTHRHSKAASFGVMEHEENSHFDSRPSFSPREAPSVKNLSSWAEVSVGAEKKYQQLNTARKAHWMRLLQENARREGYFVKVDPETQLFRLLPTKKASTETASSEAQRKPGSRPTGF